MRLDFGPPLNGIAQIAYVVEDIDAGMAAYTRHLGVGPWFVRGPFTPPTSLLRGRAHNPTFTVARGFSGETMLELIVQHDDGPSVFHEQPGARSYGFHHWATMSTDFDGDVARYAEAGFPEAFSDVLPSGSRVVYVDSREALGGMIEVIEYTEAQERTYAEMHQAALGWPMPMQTSEERIVDARG